MDISRRQLIGAPAKPSVTNVQVVHPPWTIDAANFSEKCTGCGSCVDACGEGIIEIADDGYPRMRFWAGECTFCQQCAHQCPEPVFNLEKERPWEIKASISKECLSNQNVACQSCRDYCPTSAIRFYRTMSSQIRIERPRIDTELCTGCGGCIGICPSDAIKLREGNGDTHYG